MRTLVRMLGLLVVAGLGSCQDQYAFTQQVYDDVVMNTNPKIRPVRNISIRTNVYVTYNLAAITDFDEVSQTLTTAGYFMITWEDEIMKWNPALYGGVFLVKPRFDHIWKPSLVVSNSVKDIEPFAVSFGIFTTLYNGTVIWYPGGNYKTFCKLDVSKYPFDEHTCTICLLTWDESESTVNLITPTKTVSLESYNGHSEWEILSTSVETTVKVLSATRIPEMKFILRLKRRPVMKILTVILPVLMLSMLNVVVFLIPVQSGEKLSFAITVLLSFAVFMSFITNMLPHSADSISIFTLLLAGLFVLSTLYVVLSAWVVQIFHRDPVKRPVPGWVRRWVMTPCCGAGKGDNSVHVIDAANEKRRDVDRSWQTVSETVDRIFFWVFLFLSLLLVTATVLMISDVSFL